MEKRGIRTDRGDLNCEIGVTNQQIRQLRARINCYFSQKMRRKDGKGSEINRIK